MKLLTNHQCKGSHSWYKCFKKRLNLTLKKRNSFISNKKWNDDTTIDEKCNSFVSRYIELTCKNKYEDDCIINVDETAVLFNNLYRKTVVFKGKKKK